MLDSQTSLSIHQYSSPLSVLIIRAATMFFKLFLPPMMTYYPIYIVHTFEMTYYPICIVHTLEINL